MSSIENNHISKINAVKIDNLERRMIEHEHTIKDELNNINGGFKDLRAEVRSDNKDARDSRNDFADRMAVIEAKLASIDTYVKLAGVILGILLTAMLALLINHITALP